MAEFFAPPESPLDVEGEPLFRHRCFYGLQQVEGHLGHLRERVLASTAQQENAKAQEVALQGETFLETSLLKLEERLKVHYPVKGQIETEIFQ